MVDLAHVGCRLPHGLHLDVPTADGQKRVTLMGANRSRLINGAGVTPVPKDHWEAWLALYSTLPCVQNGAVFATRNPAEAEREGESRAEDRTGFEQAEPQKGTPVAAFAE